MFLILAILLLPNPQNTPGKSDPTKTKEILCSPHYSTKSVRPKDSYTNKLKLSQIKAMNLTGKPSDYEEDHLISLEIGGDPKSPLNLWPQKYPYAKWKDKLENKLHKLVCQNKISLATAQKDISTNWVSAYMKYIGPLPNAP